MSDRVSAADALNEIAVIAASPLEAVDSWRALTFKITTIISYIHGRAIHSGAFDSAAYFKALTGKERAEDYLEVTGEEESALNDLVKRVNHALSKHAATSSGDVITLKPVETQPDPKPDSACGIPELEARMTLREIVALIETSRETADYESFTSLLPIADANRELSLLMGINNLVQRHKIAIPSEYFD